MSTEDSMGQIEGIEYQPTEKDYLELWRYFGDKATSVKGAMFTTTSAGGA
jgi:hypothetical protein